MTRATEPNANSFSAETHELRAAARNVRDAIEEFGTGSALKYRLDAHEAGHPRLGAELAGYQRASADSVELLRADAQELATRLTDSAADYEGLDSDLASVLSDVVHRQ
ncbi:hypothetical protein HUO13_02730 [Saccharopolyspora erythraea]|uniref:hypothetical protein n=1 Tax=Saccharopolyspora erythraea TaxID=1836 RepID=UPI001BA4FC80|nr:hypothetical protein [Saccharopolyspora erythraea]QUG99861.1 hypothetical protein HUO13_02730 [Saccharopolyspora erythraea]